MIIGIDFDNTLICYDSVFLKIADELGIKLNGETSPKTELRNLMRMRKGGEWEWSRIQGLAYGRMIIEAKPFPDVEASLLRWIANGHSIRVISHKSIYPTAGLPYNLIEAAKNWIHENFPRLLSAEFDIDHHAFFESTRKEKLKRIARERCNWFIDDLPETLRDIDFPRGTLSLLFEPGQDLGNQLQGKLRRIRTWKEISSIIDSSRPSERPLDQENSEDNDSREPKVVFSGLIQNRLSTSLLDIEELRGGMNNRSYSLRTSDGRVLFGKIYKQSLSDYRDRFAHEVKFLSYSEELEGRRTPTLLETDANAKAAILTLEEGALWPDETDAPLEIWNRFLEFLLDLQQKKDLSKAKKMPRAAESCDTLQEHLDLVSKRRNLWLARAKANEVEHELANWIQIELEDAFQKLAKRMISSELFRKPISPAALIISPSDFGLHNALFAKDGSIRFIDFEYAGWDDPAKTISDFFAQPRYPAPRELYEDWKSTLASLLPQEEVKSFSERLPLISSCIELKWIYVIMGKRLSTEPSTNSSESEDIKRQLRNRLGSFVEKMDT